MAKARFTVPISFRITQGLNQEIEELIKEFNLREPDFYRELFLLGIEQWKIKKGNSGVN